MTPPLYYASGGDVMMSLSSGPVCLDAETQKQILADYEIHRRAAEAAGAGALWGQVARYSGQLTKAQEQAALWARAGVA